MDKEIIMENSECAKKPLSSRYAFTKQFLFLIVITCVLVPLSPVVTYWVFKLNHRFSYKGVCGPHGPDISAWSYSFEEYMNDFGAGFDGLGLALGCLMSSFLPIILVPTIWIAAHGLRLMIRKYYSK